MTAERGRGRRDHGIGGRAGPPAKRIATRRIVPDLDGLEETVEDMENSCPDFRIWFISHDLEALGGRFLRLARDRHPAFCPVVHGEWPGERPRSRNTNVGKVVTTLFFARAGGTCGRDIRSDLSRRDSPTGGKCDRRQLYGKTAGTATDEAGRRESERSGRDHLTAIAGDQSPGTMFGIDRLLDETHRAVAEEGVESAGELAAQPSRRASGSPASGRSRRKSRCRAWSRARPPWPRRRRWCSTFRRLSSRYRPPGEPWDRRSPDRRTLDRRSCPARPDWRERRIAGIRSSKALLWGLSQGSSSLNSLKSSACSRNGRIHPPAQERLSILASDVCREAVVGTV